MELVLPIIKAAKLVLRKIKLKSVAASGAAKYETAVTILKIYNFVFIALTFLANSSIKNSPDRTKMMIGLHTDTKFLPFLQNLKT